MGTEHLQLVTNLPWIPAFRLIPTNSNYFEILLSSSQVFVTVWIFLDAILGRLEGDSNLGSSKYDILKTQRTTKRWCICDLFLELFAYVLYLSTVFILTRKPVSILENIWTLASKVLIHPHFSLRWTTGSDLNFIEVVMIGINALSIADCIVIWVCEEQINGIFQAVFRGLLANSYEILVLCLVDCAVFCHFPLQTFSCFIRFRFEQQDLCGF